MFFMWAVYVTNTSGLHPTNSKIMLHSFVSPTILTNGIADEVSRDVFNVKTWHVTINLLSWTELEIFSD